MKGKTHISVGIAAALAVMHPTAITGLICASVGGALGGALPDFDVGERKIHVEQDNVSYAIAAAGILGAMLLIDYNLGNGIIAYIQNHYGIPVIVAGTVFVIVLIHGICSPHRSFTHSVFACAFFTGTLYVLCRPLAAPFGIGYASHLLLDLPNKKGMPLFYPFFKRKKICLNWFESDNISVNNILAICAAMVSVIIISISASMSVIGSDDVMQILAAGKDVSILGKLNKIQLYLCAMNLLTFVLGCIDRIQGNYLQSEAKQQRRVLTLSLNILSLAGGALGNFIAVSILGQKLNKDGALPYLGLLSMTILWGIIYCIICEPFAELPELNSTIRLTVLIAAGIYLLAVNIVTFILFLRQPGKAVKRIQKKDLLIIILSVFGGTIGSFIALAISRNNLTSKIHYTIILPLLLSVQSFAAGYLLVYGFI